MDIYGVLTLFLNQKVIAFDLVMSYHTANHIYMESTYYNFGLKHLIGLSLIPW